MKRLSNLICAAILVVAGGAAHASTILYEYSLVSGIVTEDGVSDLTSTSGTFSLTVDENGVLAPSTGSSDPSPILGFQFAGGTPTPGLSAFATPLSGGIAGFRVSFLLLQVIGPVVETPPTPLLSMGTTTPDASQAVPVSSMPIPAALPMLAAGFGLLGFLRHRRRKALPNAA